MQSALAMVAISAAADSSPPVPDDPTVFLDRAFDKMFNYPSVRRIELKILRNSRVAGRRVFDVAYRKFDGLGHTILRFRAPEYLRDNALLMIETPAGDNDTWLYQPQVGHLRRVSTYQKGDSFYGSDLTFEDLENRRWENYRARYAEDAEVGGQKFHVVEAFPRGHSPYSRISIYVAVRSLAIGRIEFFKGEESSPFRTILVDLGQLVEEAGVFKPGTMRVEVGGRDWATEIVFTRIEVSPDITSKAFSAMRLLAEGEDLFRMVERSSE